MDHETLLNLKYKDLQCLARAKLGTLRRVTKEKLIQQILKAAEKQDTDEASSEESIVEVNGDVALASTSSSLAKKKDLPVKMEAAGNPSHAEDEEIGVRKAPTAKSKNGKRRGVKRAKKDEEVPAANESESGKNRLSDPHTEDQMEQLDMGVVPIVLVEKLQVDALATDARRSQKKKRRAALKKSLKKDEERSPIIRSEQQDSVQVSPVTKKGDNQDKLNETFEVTPASRAKTRSKKRSFPEEVEPSDGNKLDDTFEVAPSARLASKRRRVEAPVSAPVVFTSARKGQVATKGKPTVAQVTPIASRKLPLKTPVSHKKESQIPRFVNYVKEQRKVEQSSPVFGSQRKTPRAPPNFAELHQREFEKMESVNDYVTKKKQRLATLTTSVAKARSVSQQTREVMDQVKKRIVNEVTFDVRKSEAAKKDSVFQPVLSLTDVKLDFASGSKLKTPKFTAKGSVAKHKQTTVETFGQSPGKVAKTKLAKPVSRSSPRNSTYKPHKGSLKPFRNNERNNKSVLSTSTFDSRVEQRTIIKGVRTNRRFELQMQHRGLL